MQARLWITPPNDATDPARLGDDKTSQIALGNEITGPFDSCTCCCRNSSSDELAGIYHIVAERMASSSCEVSRQISQQAISILLMMARVQGEAVVARLVAMLTQMEGLRDDFDQRLLQWTAGQECDLMTRSRWRNAIGARRPKALA